MDIKKDIQGGNALSRNLREGTSPARDREGSQRGFVSNGMDAFSVSMSKRSERLATAVYLVTNFLSDSEPLKGRLRMLSLDLVREAGSVRYGAPTLETITLDTLKGTIGETVALLELAFIAGLISEMNFTILKREYASLRDAIEIKKASRESRTDAALSGNFFGQSLTAETTTFLPNAQSQKVALESKLMTEENKAVALTATQESSIGQVVRNASDVMSDTNKKGTSNNVSKGHTKDNQSKKSSPHSPSIVAPSVERDSRRARIVKLVKDNREAGIKDIVAHFPDVSEKTIQRELVSLTEGGVLKKFGERRWSRYSLA